jgi:hypothetical protein
MADNNQETEETPFKLVKGSERKSRRNANGRLEHTTKISYWCLGIIVIVLLFYFLGNMITDAEDLDAGNGASNGDDNSSVNNSII